MSLLLGKSLHLNSAILRAALLSRRLARLDLGKVKSDMTVGCPVCFSDSQLARVSLDETLHPQLLKFVLLRCPQERA